MSIISIRDGLLATQDSSRRVFRGNLIIEDGKIISVGGELDKSDTLIDASGSLVMPGLANMHTHLGMSMLRGRLTSANNLDEFLKITSEFDKGNDSESVKRSVLLGMAEMISTGTTSFLDLYYSEEITAYLAEKVGIRGFLSWAILDKEYTTQEGVPIENAEKFVKKYGNMEMVRPSFGIQGVYVCSEETIKKVAELAEKYNTIIHLHLAETEEEVRGHIDKCGERPAEFLNKRKILSRRVGAAHCVWLDDEEIKSFSSSGATMIYNPISNAKLRSGRAKAKELLQNRVNMAIGTDSTGSNDNLDMFQTMKFGALIGDLSPQSILDMATINAAKFLGEPIGSLEKGKYADVIILDLKKPLGFPTDEKNAISNIVYSLEGGSVSTSIISGKVVMQDRKFISPEFEELGFD